MNPLHSVVSSLIAGVRAINRKYAQPQIKITPFVRICLLALRVYLLILVGLMVYKFIITVK